MSSWKNNIPFCFQKAKTNSSLIVKHFLQMQIFIHWGLGVGGAKRGRDEGALLEILQIQEV